MNFYIVYRWNTSKHVRKSTASIVTQKRRSICCNGSLVSPMQSGHHYLLEDSRCYHVQFYIAKECERCKLRLWAHAPADLEARRVRCFRHIVLDISQGTLIPISENKVWEWFSTSWRHQWCRDFLTSSTAVFMTGPRQKTKPDFIAAT